jgi:uncharacterized protein (DUF58 family)
VADSPKYFDPRTLAKLEGLAVRARHIVEGFVAGGHRSPYHGFSIEFAEHREYTPGDDLRYVDWKVFGRSDKFYLKQFEEETNLICYLVLDASESMSYRGPQAPLSKLEYAQCAAVALAYLVLRQQDSVGLVTFDDEIRQSIRPSGQAGHWKQLVEALDHTQAVQKTRTGPILHALADRFARRGLVLLLSDLFDNVEAALTGLKHLRHSRHDVVVMHVLDPAELDFPFRHTTQFHGLEGFPDVVTDPASLRKAYRAEFDRFLQAVRAGCRQQQIDYVLMRTDQPLDIALAGYLASRMTRVS